VKVGPASAGLHGHPPLTPAAVLIKFRFVVPSLVVGFACLAFAASISGGSILLTWDEPVERTVDGTRTGWLVTTMRAVTQLGGTRFVAVGLAVLLLILWRQCHSLALVILVAVLARPVLEWGLKSLVGRPRPSLNPMVGTAGHSFPSGHVMAAVALWGLLPPIVALFTHRRLFWWASVVLSVTVIGLVAASRVQLGAHWLSDVMGAILLGSLYLLAVEWALDWHHERAPCQAFMRKGHDLDADLSRGDPVEAQAMPGS
jgi:undecaprenyl-diphosphatase